MSYAVVDDLVARFGERELIQLTDRSTPPADAIDPTVAQPALDAASTIIDGYVAAKYALPLQTTPALLIDLCADIARYRLYADRVTELVTDRYKQALATLKLIAEGKIKIDTAAIEPESRPSVIVTQSNERLFTRRSLRGL